MRPEPSPFGVQALACSDPKGWTPNTLPHLSCRFAKDSGGLMLPGCPEFACFKSWALCFVSFMNPATPTKESAHRPAPQDFGELSMRETIRRNLRKTPKERVETLMGALRDTEQRGWWPVVDRHAKEQRLLCSIRERLSQRSTVTRLATS